MLSVDKPKLSPPYCSFRSFNTFLDARREDGHVTDVVDRSLMSTFAGSTAGELLSALKSLSFIDEKGAPSDRYKEYVPADNESRVAMLASAMRNSYPYLLAAENFNVERATSQQVIEQFRAQGISGSTLTRAMIFFLAAAKQAGIKVSPNIRAPGTPLKPNKPKPVATPAPGPAPAPDVAAPTALPIQPSGVQVFEIPIPIGRKVTIAIPNQFSSADWELFQTMLTAYVQHWKTQMADLQKSTTETEGNGA